MLGRSFHTIGVIYGTSIHQLHPNKPFGHTIKPWMCYENWILEWHTSFPSGHFEVLQQKKTPRKFGRTTLKANVPVVDF